MDKSISIPLKDIFLVFLKIGTFSFGGVYSMLAFFEKELVEKQKWITHEEFIDSIALGQMMPGPPIINTGIYIGYKLRGIKGAVTVILGQVFTGTLLSIVIAIFYIKIRNNVILEAFLKGIGSAVVGLLLSIIYKMSKETIKDYKVSLFAVASFIALILFKLNPITIIVSAGFAGLLFFSGKTKRCS